MNKYQFTIDTILCSETLERIFRVVRHRKFKIITMSMRMKTEQKACIELLVTSERTSYILSTQLEKLVDVLAVTVSPYNEAIFNSLSHEEKIKNEYEKSRLHMV